MIVAHAGEPKYNGAVLPGDKVTIKAQGVVVVGIVLSGRYYGADGGWYIEMIHANVPGGYSYWKQGQDGGHILMVERGE